MGCVGLVVADCSQESGDQGGRARGSRTDRQGTLEDVWEELLFEVKREGQTEKSIKFNRYDYEGVLKSDAETLMNNLNGQFEFFNVGIIF